MPAAETPAQQIERIEKLIQTKQDEEVPRLLRELRKRVERLLANDASNPAHHCVLSRVLFHLGSDDAASLASASRAVELAPEDAAYRHWKAMVLLAVGRADEAVPELRRACELAPERSDYAAALVEALSADEETAEAKDVLAGLIRREPKNARWLGMRAGFELAGGDEAAALQTWRRAIEVDPSYFNGWFNLGQLAQNHKRHAEALKMFQECVELHPEELSPRGKTVQCFQALGRLRERDAARREILSLQADGKIRERTYCRDQFEVAGRRLIVTERFELEGDRPVRYSFNVVDERDRTVERVSLGSYEMTTRIAREGGTIGPDQRMYHLDGYAPGRHVTYRMFTSEPSYDEVRKMVVEIFEGKLEALSSTTEDGE